ncbi:hypothetical protein NPIL_452121 [Nephila pilipes]|uniref:Uncharacterized protein n=1 Tax=Nephila pilipes TaxID=299642 RepID=A0A8X6QV15_NEPPI|nr:hypothetical protein NPIL_452121 [Nephila pilipes]
MFPRGGIHCQTSPSRKVRTLRKSEVKRYGWTKRMFCLGHWVDGGGQMESRKDLYEVILGRRDRKDSLVRSLMRISYKVPSIVIG